MSEEIIKVLDELGKRFGMAIDWSNQNLMPYLQELMCRFIVYKNVQAIIWIIISIIVICLSIWGIKKLYKWKKEKNIEEYDDDWLGCVLGMLGMALTLIVFIIVLICHLQGLIQNIILPELSVIDYLNFIK